jgi:hypothetical protein
MFINRNLLKGGREMRKVLIFAVMVTLLFATSALAFDNETIEQRRFNISPFCDVVTIEFQQGGQIWGTNDNCGAIPPVRVGGWFDNVQDWVMFIDWPGVSQGYFEYGVIKGSGRNGTLYRWETNGNQAAPLAVTLVNALSEGGGPAGALE